MTFLVDGTNGGTFPSWTTATRPASPAVGQMGYNTTTGQFDAYTSNGWVSVATSKTAPTSGPAFSVYQGVQQTGIPSTTATNVTFDTKIFDTNTNFSTATSRFTPTVAGYYFVSFGASMPYAAANAFIQSTVAKNGVNQFNSAASIGYGGALYPQSAGSGLIYMDGIADYLTVSVYGTNSSSTYNLVAGNASTFFNGYLARSA